LNHHLLERRHLSSSTSNFEGRPNHHQQSNPSFMTTGVTSTHSSYFNSNPNSLSIQAYATLPRNTRRRHEASPGETSGETHSQSSSFLNRIHILGKKWNVSSSGEYFVGGRDLRLSLTHKNLFSSHIFHFKKGNDMEFILTFSFLAYPPSIYRNLFL
jgi:hypothetical protein